MYYIDSLILILLLQILYLEYITHTRARARTQARTHASTHAPDIKM